MQPLAKKNKAPIIMIGVMFISLIGTLINRYIYTQTANQIAEYLTLILGIVSAHFLVMHISAPIVYLLFKKRIQYDSFWFQTKKFESTLYRKIRIKKIERYPSGL